MFEKSFKREGESPAALPEFFTLPPWKCRMRNMTEKYQILLVEDTPTNQFVAMAMLRKMGHKVELATNGQQALAALGRQSFDLILMDIEMPGMDGLEVTRIIRGPAGPTPNPTIPIIALTAHAGSQDAEKCRRAGMNDFLAKPFDLEKLGTIVKKWLPG